MEKVHYLIPKSKVEQLTLDRNIYSTNKWQIILLHLKCFNSSSMYKLNRKWGIIRRHRELDLITSHGFSLHTIRILAASLKVLCNVGSEALGIGHHTLLNWLYHFKLQLGFRWLNICSRNEKFFHREREGKSSESYLYPVVVVETRHK